MTGFSPAVSALIEKRSGGVCEGCGVAPATEKHHRQFRSRGGSNRASNGLHLCGWGNHTGCHGRAHAGAIGESLGWAIRSGFDPLEVPVFRHVDSTWWRYDDDGSKTQIPAADAVEYLRLIGAIKDGLAAK